ncbi:type II toxin-antitoxin system RelE/ParE family toxin [Methylobacterium trifolii]|uniref:Addiction module killer protein n=1 Tax=Methylobacterium trifolii TaxID=1003092 RepID=A0ABQ4TV65_9HYPH|nr:type II toxin-antitoxin system RelE/ParE family toxin [Methylobacterium trifolii]GJE59176.1 hypothetical protein MPOCJGCO_1264 [Methylobacterium trifolii]
MIKGLRDKAAVGVINLRLKRLAQGNPGDAEPVGGGVSELKIDFGPGYRVYYKIFSNGTIILYGGDKDDQPGNIKSAKALAKSIDETLEEKRDDASRNH